MSERPDPTLIQMYCDGECTPEQCAQVAGFLEADPEAQLRIQAQAAFNARLRSCLCATQAMQCCSAPPELRSTLRDILNEAEAAGQALPKGKVKVSSPASQRWAFGRLFEDPRRGNIFAIAATLAIVAGAVLYGLFGRNIDQVRPPQPSEVFAQAAVFASSEHSRWAGNGKAMADKAVVREIVAAEGALSRWLDAPVTIANLGGCNYDFVCAGQSALPVAPRSGHILYRRRIATPAGTPMASVFVFPTRGLCGGNLCEGMDCRVWYQCFSDQCAHKVLRSTDGKLVYVLVCCDDREIDLVARTLTGALHQPPG